MKPLSKKIALVTLLTLFFLIDDLLYYLLFVNFYRRQIDPALLALASLVVFALNFALAVAVVRVLRKRPTTGMAGMVGKVGVVIKENPDEVWVKVQGEIWRASSKDRLRRGEEVVVEDLHGLVLFVKKRTRP